MKFDRKAKTLDVTEAQFGSVDALKSVIKGSHASKIGFETLIMTKEQMKWYSEQSPVNALKVLAHDVKEEAKKIRDGRIKKDKEKQEARDKDDKIHGRSRV